jgi:hypothetical protein
MCAKSARDAHPGKLNWRFHCEYKGNTETVREARRGEAFGYAFGARSAPGISFGVCSAREARRGRFLGVFPAREARRGNLWVCVRRAKRAGQGSWVCFRRAKRAGGNFRGVFGARSAPEKDLWVVFTSNTKEILIHSLGIQYKYTPWRIQSRGHWPFCIIC